MLMAGRLTRNFQFTFPFERVLLNSNNCVSCKEASLVRTINDAADELRLLSIHEASILKITLARVTAKAFVHPTQNHGE